jgi:hypothetical protein
MLYKEELRISKGTADFTTEALTFNPSSEDEVIMTEDDTVVELVTFANGYEMEIKCCGVQFDCPEGCNTAYAEAVLFDDYGKEVCCTDTDDSFLGEWELEDKDGNTYIVDVVTE